MRGRMAWWDRLLWYLRRYRRVRVCMTQDRRLYYVKRYAWARAASFSVAKHPMPLPELKGGSLDGWMKSGIEITKGTGEHYWREIYPFAFYKLPSHSHEELVRADDDLVVDYEADTVRYLASLRRR